MLSLGAVDPAEYTQLADVLFPLILQKTNVSPLLLHVDEVEKNTTPLVAEVLLAANVAHLNVLFWAALMNLTAGALLFCITLIKRLDPLPPALPSMIIFLPPLKSKIPAEIVPPTKLITEETLDEGRMVIVFTALVGREAGNTIG